MIVSRLPAALLVVTQADHARLAADLLSLLPIPALVEHPRRGELLRAVAEHDNGWWEADAAPLFDPATGGPVDFRAVDDEVRRKIWRRGVARHAAADPYVAAMIATHALRLLGQRRSSHPSWDGFLAELAVHRQELAAAAGIGVEAIAVDDPWLELADELALAAATGDGSFVHRPDWRTEARAEAELTRLAIAPFPFAGATRFELASRRLPAAACSSAVELGTALATARWERRPVRVVPLGEPPDEVS